ncbi:radical SAM protein [Streptomyces sp. NPDC102381]|uniref:radical SAM protein n=1 Tax=Streptomyces sp. NPDC102381 TaxID=3366164 RepID=UPI00382DA019
MSKPDADPVYVRASVWPKCDLVCRYCPVEEGMENRVPKRLSGQQLSTEQYLRNMSAISAAGVRGVSFTGGEPTLRPDLPDIIRGVRPHFDRVELTTNGARLGKMTDVVAEHIDLLKVSMDSVNQSDVQLLTGRRFAYDHARDAITWAVSAGVPLALNAVLMQRTYPDLDRTIDFVRGLVEGATAPVHLSLLDFYYSPSRRNEWLEDFLPTNDVLGLLTDRYGEPHTQDRFGCRFYWFDADGFSVRLKDSYSATMRAPKCQGCTSYCQEGVYGIKHSVEGRRRRPGASAGRRQPPACRRSAAHGLRGPPVRLPLHGPSLLRPRPAQQRRCARTRRRLR